jgi:hypothetical protein
VAAGFPSQRKRRIQIGSCNHSAVAQMRRYKRAFVFIW